MISRVEILTHISKCDIILKKSESHLKTKENSMIKKMQNQKSIFKICPNNKNQIECYQSVNINIRPPKGFGKILCSISDECKNFKCEYHNNCED